MTTKERLVQFIDKQGISNRKFSLEIGLSHNYFTKEGGVSSDILVKIFTRHPYLNMDWVITGRGDMILKEAPEMHLLNEPGADYQVKKEDWQQKYYALLEKYNACLEVQAAKAQAS